MIALLGPLAAAAAATPPSSTLDTLLAPAGGTAAVVGLLILVVREYRSARRENVAAAKAREAQAEKDRQESDNVAEELRTRLAKLEARVEELNQTIRTMDSDHTTEVRRIRAEHATEMDTLRAAHASELDTERKRNVQLVATAWRLRETLAENGIKVPADLSAKRPDVTPLLNPALPIGDDEDDDGTPGP